MIHVPASFYIGHQISTRLSFAKTILRRSKHSFAGALLLLMISVGGRTQTVLNPGDVVIVGVNSTNPDKFSFVVLKDIATNTVINFTDNGFTAGTTPRTGEGFLTFTAQANYSAGTVFTWINGSTVTSDWNSNNPSSFSFNATGDQLFAFAGAISNWATQTGITLLFGINYGTSLSSTSSASNTVQPSLLMSNYFLNLPSSTASNNYFANGSAVASSVSVTGSVSALQAGFADAAKWFMQSNSAGAVSFPTFFVTVQWPIDAFTTSAGGTLNPNGTTFINNGASQAYTITADPGFIISNVSVDGSPVGTVNDYTFNNVNRSHTISAGFICVAPQITGQPLLSQEVCQNALSESLTVVANGHSLNYQWYEDDDNSDFDGSPIPGATNNSFTPTSGVAGTFFYYCIVDAECGAVPSDYSTVIVSPLLTWYRDADDDGFGDANNSTQACNLPLGYVSNNSDCDDNDNTIYPAAPEICDGKDNDCNGNIDEEIKTIFYRDADGDGFGDANNSTQACTVPSGYVSNNTDCDDNDNAVYPGAPELCDGKDNDCNGNIDEEVATNFYRDADGDGFGDANNSTQACTVPSGYVSNNSDCDDNDNAVYPGAPEICDGKDNDCNGNIDEEIKTNFYRDADGDGFGNANNSTQACIVPSGYVSNNSDCDDNDNAVYPGAPEICDGKDNDCNGNIDEAIKTIFYRDADGDGFGDANNSTQACTVPLGYVSNNSDCDDNDEAVYPRAPEICDGKDNDCNGNIDEEIKTTFYRDADGDGFGDANNSTQACTVPSGYVSNNSDCDDNDNAVYPGAPELCDGKDNDCNGNIDEVIKTIYYRDADDDGFGDANNSTQACTVPQGYVINNSDCDDHDNAVYPGAPELCDGKDNNCDGLTDNNAQILTWYKDNDGDGYGNPALGTQACTKPAGYVGNNEDCNDNNATVFPGAPELCDGIDNNCNGQSDENGGTTYYRDADGDGYGNPAISTRACTKPQGYVTNSTDCNDGSKNVHPAATETCGNGIDDNCNGQIDESCTASAKICAYSQVAYDNNSIACGVTGVSSLGQVMLNAVDIQPGDSVIFGSKTTGRFFTLKKSDVQSGYIYKLLPGSGSSKALKGYATYAKSSTWSNVPLSMNGAIQNELLAQAMTLFFNLQLSPQVGALPLNTNLNIRRLSFCTVQGSLVRVKFSTTAGVASCMQTKYGTQGMTVNNLLKLANELLGNVNICNLKYTDVSNALKNVNELFNGCAIVTLPNSTSSSTQVATTGLEKDLKEANGELAVNTAPNPFASNVRFTVISPETGKLKILIYDVNGVRRGELEQNVVKDLPVSIWFRNIQSRQGMLFYRVWVNGHTAYGKLVQVN